MLSDMLEPVLGPGVRQRISIRPTGSKPALELSNSRRIDTVTGYTTLSFSGSLSGLGRSRTAVGYPRTVIFVHPR
jgi:hypothetical protein